MDWIMFRMDTIVKNLLDLECQRAGRKYAFLTPAEIETLVLGQLEAEGKAMRYLRRNGKTIAWKATPKTRKKMADYEALMAEDNGDND
jgi:hypothetical protein